MRPKVNREIEPGGLVRNGLDVLGADCTAKGGEMTYFPTGTYAAILIPWNVFRSTPIYWLGKPLNEMGVTMKVATRYQYDNRHQRIEFRSGEEFSFSLVQVTAQINSPLDREMRKKFPKYHGGPNGSNAWTVTLWNARGLPAGL